MSVAFILAFNSLAAITPLFLTQKANAAGTTIVRDSNRQGWTNGTTQTGGTQSFVADSNAPAGSGALQLTTTSNKNSKAQLVKSTDVKLADITNLSYYTKQVSGPAEANASFQLTLSGLNGGGTTNLVFETYWNDDDQPIVNGTWQQWDVAGGKFWSSASRGGLTNGAGGPPLYTLADVKALNPNAKVTSFGVNVGTSNLNYTVRVDNLVFNDDTYNFEPEASPAIKGENFNTHSGSDYKGINVGFTIADFGTVSSVAVDLYKDAQKIATNTHNDALLALINSGTTQLSTPFIIEPGTYTEEYWNLGPANWKFNAKPTKAVITVAGANGTRTTEITPLTEPNDWTYESVVPLEIPSQLTPTNGATVNGATLTNSWSAVEGATKYEYQSFNNEAGTNLRHKEIRSNTSKTATNVANNTVFWWKVRALTDDGKQSEWSPLWKVTVDNEVPTTPTNGAPHNTFKKTAGGWSYTWNSSVDNTGPVTYEYQTSRNSAQTGGVLTTDLWNNIINGNAAQNNLTFPTIPSIDTQDGTWYWQVRAIDVAGNKSGWSQIWNVTVDTAKPVIDNVTPGAGSILKGTVTFKLDWSDAHKSYSYIELNKNGSWKTDNTKDSNPHADQLTINTKDYPDGGYNIKVTVTDKAGNGSQQIFPITIDNTFPTVDIHELPNKGLVDGSSFTLTGTASDTNLEYYKYQLLDRNKNPVAGSLGWSQLGGNSSVTNGTLATVDVTGLSEGDYYIRVWARDSAGNQTGDKNAPYTIPFTIDREAPVITKPVKFTDGNIAENSTVTGTKTFRVEQTEANPDRMYVEYQVKDAAGKWQKKLGKWYYDINTADFTVDTSQYPEGANQVKISTWDKLNHHTGHSFLVTVDRQAPVVTINAPSGGTFGGTSNSVAINFTVDDPNIASWTLTGTDLSQSGNTNGTFNANWNVSDLSSGVHTAALTAHDKAGNPQTTDVQITIDNLAAITTNLKNDDELSNNVIITASLGEPGTLALTFKDSEGKAVDIDEPAIVNNADGTLSLEFNTRQLANGTYAAVFTATDTLGNDTALTVSFDVFNTAHISRNTDETPVASFGTAALTPPQVPAGLVANQFNTNNPQALGIAIQNTNTNTTGQNNTGKVKAANTENKEKEIVESASSTFAWYWILLLIAVAVAAYYAYRNWRLDKEK